MGHSFNPGKPRNPVFFYLPGLARTSQENSIRNSFKICRSQAAYNLFFNKVGCIFSRIFGYFSVFFFLLEKFTLFQMSFYSISNHGEKKNTSGKKKQLFHSFNRFFAEILQKWSLPGEKKTVPADSSARGITLARGVTPTQSIKGASLPLFLIMSEWPPDLPPDRPIKGSLILLKLGTPTGHDELLFLYFRISAKQEWYGFTECRLVREGRYTHLVKKGVSLAKPHFLITH